MLAMWTKKSISLMAIVMLLNKALKFFFCQSKSTIMDAANLQQKFLFHFSTATNFLQARNWQSNESQLEDSRHHQSLIVNWLIRVRRFSVNAICCGRNMGWNERGVKWMWGKMIWGEMILGWNERTPWFITHVSTLFDWCSHPIFKGNIQLKDTQNV